MSGAMIGALMALSLVQQTDTVIALDGATRLDIENSGGTYLGDHVEPPRDPNSGRMSPDSTRGRIKPPWR